MNALNVKEIWLGHIVCPSCRVVTKYVFVFEYTNWVYLYLIISKWPYLYLAVIFDVFGQIRTKYRAITH